MSHQNHPQHEAGGGPCCPVLARRVPTICVLLSTLFQERVSNFAINMMLLHAMITEKNMRINILESSGLTKPEDLVIYKSVLNRGTNSVQLILRVGSNLQLIFTILFSKSISELSSKFLETTSTNKTQDTTSHTYYPHLYVIKGLP
jgi:hypothetical protein